MPALVAKSYTGLEQLTEPYKLNGKMYVKVRTKKGEVKQVRAYSESEYKKYNPEVKIIQPPKSRRHVLGFGEKGYIWIFKGNTYANLDWFRSSECRFARTWGWYLPSDIEMPNPLPVDIEPIKLTWEQVSENDVLYSEDKLIAISDELKYDAGTSNHVGEVGERIEFDAICSIAKENASIYGISYFYVFEGKDGNIYTWTTNTKQLQKDQTYHIKGTVKDHKVFRAQKQTVLTRCKVEEIEE